METLNAPDTARGEMTRIGKSVAIKGEVSCGEDLYIDGQVEGTIDPKGNRLIIGPNGSVKANINARAVIVKGKLEGTIHARPGRLKAVGHCRGRHHDSAHLH